MKTQSRHLFLRYLRKVGFFINRFDDTKKTRSTQKNGRLVCFLKNENKKHKYSVSKL